MNRILIGLAVGFSCLSMLAFAEESPFQVGPYVQFLTPSTAKLCWRTERSFQSVVDIRHDGVDFDSIPVDSSHDPCVLLQGLEPKSKYIYQITLFSGEKEIKSASHEIDTAMNYTKYPLPDYASIFQDDRNESRVETLANTILTAAGVSKGYCVIYGCVNGRLAYELARQSEFTVIGFDDDPSRIQQIRRQFIKNNLYGVRFTFHHAPSLDQLPLPDAFANLIVSERMLLEGALPGCAEEAARILRPSGGIAWLGWPVQNQRTPDVEKLDDWLRGVPYPIARNQSDDVAWLSFRRPSLPDAGSWTHQYGNPANTANSGDTLFGASRTDHMSVQWLGRPGADFGLDRNPRMPSPLAVNGRLFHQGMNRLAAMDAYNGAILWTLEIPDLRRVNMPRDAGNWCADDDYLYMAIQEECWKINAGNGKLEKVFHMPRRIMESTHEWGFIASQNDWIYGSCVKKGSVYTEFFGNESWYDQTSGYGTGKICSDLLFACRKDDGRIVWEYEGGVVIHSTIALRDEKFVFVESRHPSLKELKTSRIENAELWLDQYLVCLDSATGEKIWEKPLDTHDGVVVFFLAMTDASIIISSSSQGEYHLYSFSADNGEFNWHSSHPWPSDNHGGHMQHPAIVNQTVYLEPCGYDLKTGERITESMGRHSGCATYAATSNALIYRGDSRRISMWDFNTGEVTSWFNLRPSCWLSVIPAGGMILAPEGGGGCSCGNWLETSVGFMPAKISLQ
ncbi:MAG: PQQ-binding-like beta-propeller repeat protein [Candidatus Omnitrophica bacterium]|nr:PQQ-binding-like beta-propeller repeat protein [Candidatus Omnitrophota bacterium]